MKREPTRDAPAHAVPYCVQVDEIILTDVTWIRWPLALDAIEPPLVLDPPLGAVLPLLVLPALDPAPLAPVEPAAPLDPAVDAFDARVPVTST
ncbi:MAG: hypothetical protein U0Q55_13950 [Vicinamibacterales bacterium]